jgi:hypothetical protein
MKHLRHQSLWAIICLLAGFMLIAASSELPEQYWQQPAAASSKQHHDWSDLEKDLRPEACAQCHDSQFQAWKKSLHAHAYSEGMIGQFPGMGNHSRGNNCLVCHAPLKEQQYQNDDDMLESLKIKIRQPEGVNSDADLEQATVPLRHTGVSCAVCHVRGLQRFGPPRMGSQQTGHINTDVHGGFTASKAFEQSQFCASCHQFPQSSAINGKPLENTIKEWQDSPFSAKGVTCQTCHMPRRRHEFKGIHDPAMVRKGVDIKLEKKHGIAQISIHSVAVGHAFPTYVTPKVVVTATARDRNNVEVKQWQWEIVREVSYRAGAWQEARDTRIMPDERRVYRADDAPTNTATVQFQVRVIPDAFYRGVYESLLAGTPSERAETLLKTALKRTHSSEFDLFNDVVTLR